jgi:hypothetical protein
MGRWVFGVRVQDPACAFRLYRRAQFERIPIQSDGAFAGVEILAKANFLGALIAEETVAYTPPERPELAVDSPAGEKTRAAAYRLFKHPDFGPAFLPGPKEDKEACPSSP